MHADEGIDAYAMNQEDWEGVDLERGEELEDLQEEEEEESDSDLYY